VAHATDNERAGPGGKGYDPATLGTAAGPWPTSWAVAHERDLASTSWKCCHPQRVKTGDCFIAGVAFDPTRCRPLRRRFSWSRTATGPSPHRLRPERCRDSRATSGPGPRVRRPGRTGPANITISSSHLCSLPRCGHRLLPTFQGAWHSACHARLFQLAAWRSCRTKTHSVHLGLRQTPTAGPCSKPAWRPCVVGGALSLGTSGVIREKIGKVRGRGRAAQQRCEPENFLDRS